MDHYRTRTPYHPYADITVHHTVRTLILPYAVPSVHYYYRTLYRPYADITVRRTVRKLILPYTIPSVR
ncbi:hypothetical protein M8J76_001466 [Diaphorina citri]|nr:hypothetical protein M8J76_001466 [Diaphorina citri]